MDEATRALVLLAGLAAATTLASAQDVLVAPRALTMPEPPQPTNAAGIPVEGWVTVRYSLRADGTPTEIRVLEVVPPSIDPEAAIETFASWTFAPGTRDGEAIAWHNNESVVVFASQTPSSAAGTAFEEGHAAVAAMIEAEDFDGALAANASLLDERATRLNEIGRALYHEAIIQIGRRDFYAALKPARMATDRRVPTLGSADLFGALQMRMQIEDGLGRVRDALESHERIAFALGPEDLNEALTVLGEDLAYRWENTEILEVAGRIDDGAWRFDPGRRIFTIDQVAGGRIDSIDAECDTTTVTLPYQAAVDWELPGSFGECTLFVNGESGTRFTFYELLPEDADE